MFFLINKSVYSVPPNFLATLRNSALAITLVLGGFGLLDLNITLAKECIFLELLFVELNCILKGVNFLLKLNLCPF